MTNEARAHTDSPAAELVATPPHVVDVWGQDSFPASDPPANW